MQNFMLHRGVDIPRPYPNPSTIPPGSLPVPQAPEGWLEIIDPALPSGFPPVREPLPFAPSLQVH